MEEKQKKKRDQKRCFRLGKFFLWFFLAIFLLVFLIYLFLFNTQTGIQTVENTINRFLDRPDRPLRMEINGLSGNLPFDIHIDHFEMKDPEGTFLDVKNLALTLSKSTFFTSSIHVRELSGKNFSLYRKPSLPAKEEKAKEKKKFSFPSIPKILVDKLLVEEIFIGQSLAGEDTILRLEGFLANNAKLFSSTLALTSIKGLPLQLHLEADFDRRTRILDLKGQFSENNGQLAKLVNLPALPLSLNLNGEGKPGEWLGRLEFFAGEKNSLSTDLTIALEEGWPSLAFTGTLALDPELLPGTTDAFISAAALQGHFFEDTKKSALFSDLSVRNDKIELDLTSCFLTKKQEIEADMTFVVVKPEGLSPTKNLHLGSEILLQARANGPVAKPELKASLILVEPSSGPVQFERLELKTNLAMSGTAENREIHTTGILNAEGFAMGKRIAPAPIHTNFDLTYLLSEKDLLFKQFEITSKDLFITAKGEFIQAGRVNADLELALDHIGSWTALVTDMPVSGKAQLSAQLNGGLSPLNLEIDLTSNLEDGLQGLPDPLPGLAGEKLTLRGKAEIAQTASNDIRFTVLDMKMNSPSFNLNTDISLLGKKQDLSMTADASIPELAVLFPKTGMKGSVGLQGEIDGKLHDFLFDIGLSSKNFSIPQAGSLPLSFSLSLSGRKKHTEILGDLSLEANHSGMPATFVSNFTFKEKGLRIPVLEAVLPGLHIKGNGDVNLATPLITATLTGILENGEKLGSLIGLSMKGNGNFMASFSGTESGQNLGLDLRLSSMGMNNSLELEHFEAKGSIQDLFGKKQFTAAYLVKQFTSGALSLQQSSGNAEGNLSAFSFTTKSDGDALAPVHLEMNGDYEKQNTGQKITLTKLDGKWSETPFLLEKDWELSFKGQGIFAGPLQFRFEKALLQGSGSMEPAKLAANLNIENFPAHLLPLGAQGRLDTKLQMEGTPAAPIIRLDFEGKEILPYNTQNYKGAGLNSLLKARLGGGVLSFETKLWEKSESTHSLKGKGSLPMLLSLKPFKFHIRQTVPITVSLDGQAKLDHLGFFFMPPAQSVGGTLQLDLALSGNMDKPFLHGNIRLADGSYQHMEQGVFVQNIKSHLQISPEKFEILQFTANDVNGESLEISGWLRNEPGQRAFPFEASLKAGAFQVLNSPTIFAVLKDADIRFEGDMRQQRLKGTVNLDRVEYFIKDLGGSSVPELKVTEIPSPEEEEKARPHRQRPFAPRLDLNINFPGKLFVRGRGLDSEWRGSLAIFGRSQNPGVRGTIDLVKGHIDFLGKQLDVKEGQVLLDGSRPPNPYISVKAEQEGKEVLSILKIDGQPANLKFALSSEPPLPEDEILAQMLFDRSISTISPVQAAQLAWAIGELSGVTQTPDVLGMAREMLGFDDLNLVSNGDDPDDLRIRAGKYVHERVYLKIEKDLKTDDDLIAADVELSRRFTFEGQLGTNNSGLGLYWKRDF